MRQIKTSAWFEPGDRLLVRTQQRPDGAPPIVVVASNAGRGGPHAGWDVYDGVDAKTGEEVSFVGFNIYAKSPRRGRRA